MWRCALGRDKIETRKGETKEKHERVTLAKFVLFVCFSAVRVSTTSDRASRGFRFS